MKIYNKAAMFTLIAAVADAIAAVVATLIGDK